MRDLWFFDKLMMPELIKIVLWVGYMLSILLGIFYIIAGVTSSAAGGIFVLAGIVVIIIGPITVRVFCEFMILIYRINQGIQALAPNTEVEEEH